MSDKHKLWVEAHRPQTLDQYVFQDEKMKAKFYQMVEQQTIPHLLLSGTPGSGKTTIAFILVKQLEIQSTDLLIINASDENNVETIREKIKSFVSTYPIGHFKVVLLEEADYISLQGQGILRRMMEEYSDTARFILTCNYDKKIIPAIRSRCQHFHFKSHNKADVLMFLGEILVEEDVKVNKQTLKTVEQYIDVAYPDIRKMINMLQQNVVDGKLLPPSTSREGDYKFQLEDLLARGKWQQARELVCTEVSNRDEWIEIYQYLYENLSNIDKFKDYQKWCEGIIKIAEYLHKHELVADPEINAAALFIELQQI